MRRPRNVALGLILAATLSLAGCGDSEEETPIACLDGKGAYLRALGTVPGEVRLRGEVPISDCLVANQAGGELATVGATMVAAATELNSEAHRERGNAAMRLGYLIGAVEKGAETTEGIHADLLRRLDAAARYTPRGADFRSALFQAAYEQGREAGLADG